MPRLTASWTFALAALLWPGARALAAEGDGWAVLPVRGDSPPPGDPTLLRLTREIGEAIGDLVDADVRVVTRQIRDQACPSSDGACPRHVNDELEVNTVVSMVLAPKRDALKLMVYRAKDGLHRSGELPCAWADGRVACAVNSLGKIIAADVPGTPGKVAARPARAGARSARLRPAEDKDNADNSQGPERVVIAALDAIRPRLAACKREGFGQASPELLKEPGVRLRIADGGQATEVRLDPPALHDVPAYICMALIIESLETPLHRALPHQVRYRLP
jgi:hypothetical protein